MIISNIDTTGGSDIQSSRTETLGKNDFLTLLVTQLQNQDPLSPMENTEFTAQLAQFSSLEELFNINDNLKNIELYEASMNNSQAVSFIGKEIDANGDMIQISEGTSDHINYNLAGDSTQVNISIYNSNGYLVRNINTEPQSAGEQSVEWDGNDNDGNQLPDGAYTFAVSAFDQSGSDIQVSTYMTGKVTGVTFDNGIVYLMVGDKKVTLSEVIRIKEVNS